MTILNPEIKQNEQQNQPQVDTNLDQNKVDTNLQQQKIESSEKPKTEETVEDPNWKAFREARKKDRAEREAAERRALEKEKEVAALKAAMEAAFSKSSPSPQAYQQYYGMNQPYEAPEEDEEKKIERKVEELLKKKEEQYKKEQQEYERKTYPERLRKDLPNFDMICSQENLDYLDFHFPEVSRPLQRLDDGYDKWHDIYKAVNRFIPNNTSAKKDAIRADINAAKPKSISSTMSSPTGEKAMESWQETEARRLANWQRMQRTMKGV